MQVTINDTTREVPFDTSMITLEEFMNYHEQYGRDLYKRLSDLRKKSFADEVEKVIEFNDYMDLEALAWFSFWTKADLFSVQYEPFMQPLLAAYRELRILLQPEPDIQFPLSIPFNNETWCISDYKVTPASNIVFNEIVTSKEIMRQLKTLDKDRYDAMPYLCAVFLRKENEEFNDCFVWHDGKRMNVLKNVPLKVAIQVAFFLKSYQNISLKTLVFLMGREAGIPSLN